jgi:uncharacterized protein YybS (DUF2232 family)
MISGTFFAFIDYKLTRLILKRIGQVIPDISEFSRWRLQQPYSLIVIGTAVFSVLVSFFKIPTLNVIVLNISYLLMLVFFVMGLSVIVYYAKAYGDRQGVPKGFRNIIVVLIVFVFMQFVPFVGILDLALNFRKLEPENRIGGVR